LGHDRRYSIATDKVAALGWQARRSFDEALEETVRFYVEHREWWEPLTSRVRNR
jgi:dTDP-glucose 4,6-dehydratase